MGSTVVTDLDACVLARFGGTVPPDWLLRWLDDGLGGVVLFAGNIAGPDQVRALTAELRRRRPDLLIAADEEGGDVTRLEAGRGSSFPGNLALGATGDPGLTRSAAAAIGAMLADAGINLNLAPVADVDDNLANPIIGVRSFGSDPALVAEHVAAYVTGLRDSGVAGCAKHYPGHGAADADSHLGVPVIDRSLAMLRKRDLAPFRAAIAAGVQAVMTAHVVFPAVDDRPATLSRRWLTDVLRGELGFGGVVITDALGMHAIDASVGCAPGAVLALAAGADLLCMPEDPSAQRACRAALAAAAGDGQLPSERVAAAAARVR
ncbi:MAG: beta-N-acetylhexosaminidase, partial [Streptosporangiaceae bacterium]